MNLKRRMYCLLLILVWLFAAASGESIPKNRPDSRSPTENVSGEDGLSYDDGSIRIKIETETVNDTKIFWVSVSISDPSQLQTAMAGPKGSKMLAQPMTIAKRANAVLAINGDFFTSHNSGVVYRQGEMWRNVPAYTRDELLIDESGDLHILAVTRKMGSKAMKEAVEEFQLGHEIREAFAFGPGLIIDGVRQEFDHREKVSCDYLNRAQRTIFCQTGPLEYLFLVTEGKEQFEPGFTVPECTDLLMERGGILQAYNLDGGNSSQIVLCGEKINAAEYEKARNIADMICFVSDTAP